MKKTGKIKRIMACLLAFMMLFQGMYTSLPVNAEEPGVGSNVIATGTDASLGVQGDVGEMSINADNSVGEIFSNELQGKEQEIANDNGNHIFSVEMDGNEATVSFQTNEEATVVVAIYDESGVQMLASGSEEVTSEERETIVLINTDTMPAYYLIRAYLVGSNDYEPLSSMYESPMHTQEMQDFLQTTTDDYDADRVINLDEDKTNNFAVLNENVKRIEENGAANQVVYADDTTGTYKIENADEAITSLQPGDIFSYEYEEDNLLVDKVGTIEIDGTNVTITADDSAMEEVFDYVKIDTESVGSDMDYDSSTKYEGVEYLGEVDYPEDGVYPLDDADIQTVMADDVPMTIASDDDSGEKNKSKSFAINKEYDDGISKVKVTGGVTVDLKVKAQIFLIPSAYKYVELDFEYKIAVGVKVTAKIKADIPLGKISVSPVPCISVELTPSLIFSAEGKITVQGELKGNVGFKATDTFGVRKMENLSQKPEFKPVIKAEGEIFLGFSLEPKVKVLHDKIAYIKVKGEIGAKAKMTLENEDLSDDSKKHDCSLCVKGEINLVLNVNFETKLLGWDLLKLKLETADFEFKMADFYYSGTYGEFGLGTCPHIKYKVQIMAIENNGQPDEHPLQGVAINNQYYTDDRGSAVIYLPNGIYELTATKQGYATQKKKVVVKDEKTGTYFAMEEGEDAGGDTGEIEGKKVVSVALGADHSAVITEDGSLYMWGRNNCGQLGDGTNEDRKTPIKIMDNVKSVSLGGYHSAAITEDGRLYMWGYNKQGELGDGTTTQRSTPLKVMNNVSSVELGGYHTAAIKEDGTLYMWGLNDYTIPNGYESANVAPVKVMEGVNNVALGWDHTAILTDDGVLYLCGSNDGGAIGSGNVVSKHCSLTQIMDNVQSVDLGNGYSAAITNDGSLYMWGANSFGQLGDGTKDKRYKPVKILDNVKKVSAGYAHSAAILEDGSLYMWGFNRQHQLGFGTDEDYRVLPIELFSKVEDVNMGTGAHHSAAIMDDGKLYMWGDNGYGQLGDGTTEDKLTPTRIIIPEDDVKFSSVSMEPQTVDVSNSVAVSYQTIENTNVPLPNREMNTALDSSMDAQQKTFTDLLPNETYNFYVMVSRNAESNPLGEDNLLYIAQGTSDDNGEISFTYVPTKTIENPEAFVVGKEKKDILADSLSISRTTITFEDKEPVQLTADILPLEVSNQTLSWTSDHPEIASVDENGLVTPHSGGIATITCMTTDGSELTASCTVTVYGVKEKPEAPVLKSKTADSVTLEENADYEYSMDGEIWQESSEFNNLEPDTEYAFYCRRKADEYNQASETSESLTVKTEKKEEEDTPQTPDTPQQPDTPKPVPNVNISYRTHVQSIGWQPYVSNGAMAGTSGLAKRLEGININVAGNSDLGVQYTTHVQSYGWLPWSSNGDMSGTEGEAKRLEAIKIQLTGADKDKYDIYYRVHAQSYGWLGWAMNGAPAGTAGYAKRLEGIQILVVKKGEKINQNQGGITSARKEAYIALAGTSLVVGAAATSNTNPIIGGAENPNVSYRTHVQSFGWQGWKYNGQMSGTSGQAKRLEGINIKLTNKPYSGGICYTTHVQSYGWQGDINNSATWKKDGEMAGTSGQAKRLEAIMIKLTGEMAEHYDVYYRVHAQSYGWLGWAKNGDPAGTAGYAKRLEGIQIVLVPKGGAAPANNYGGVNSANGQAYIAK